MGDYDQPGPRLDFLRRPARQRVVKVEAMINSLGRETYIMYLHLRGHKQDRNLEARLAARMVAHCQVCGRPTCQACPTPTKSRCLDFWDTHVISRKGRNGTLSRLVNDWERKVLLEP